MTPSIVAKINAWVRSMFAMAKWIVRMAKMNVIAVRKTNIQWHLPELGKKNIQHRIFLIWIVQTQTKKFT